MKNAHISSGVRSILNWNIFYKTFQFIIGDRNIYQQIIKVSPQIDNKTVVDIGCGNGRLLDFLPPTCSYIGFDFNQNYLSNAKNKYIGRKAKFIHSDVSRTSFAEIKADIIFLIGIIHHLNDSDVIKLLDQLKSALNKNGVVISIDGVLIEKQHPIAHYLMKNDRGANIRAQEHYEKLTRTTFPSSTSTLYNNLLNVPFNHIIQISQNA